MVEEALEAAQAAASKEQALKNHGATYSYEDPVMEALEPFLPKDKTTRRQVLIEIQDLARKLDTVSTTGKWTGYTIVAAIVSGQIAWLTPGFAEARAFNNMYGS